MSNLSEFDDSASTTSTTHSDFGGADGFGGICDLLRRCLLSALCVRCLWLGDRAAFNDRASPEGG